MSGQNRSWQVRRAEGIVLSVVLAVLLGGRPCTAQTWVAEADQPVIAPVASGSSSGKTRPSGLGRLFHFMGKIAHKTVDDLIRQGDEATLRQLLERTPSLANELVREANRPPLALAIDRQKIGIVRLILEKGADIHAVDEDGNTALHRAVRAGAGSNQGTALEMVDLLLTSGARLNVPNDAKETPVLSATKNGFPAAVDRLIASGADLSPSVGGSTVLHFAAVLGQPELVSVLLDRGLEANRPNAAGETPLHTAFAEREHLGVRADYSAVRQTGKIATLLLDRGADLQAPDHQGNTPLHLAAQNRLATETLELLIDRGARLERPNRQGDTPLHLASRYPCDVTNVKFLLDCGANPHVPGRDKETPLELLQRNLKKEELDVLGPPFAPVDPGPMKAGDIALAEKIRQRQEHGTATLRIGLSETDPLVVGEFTWQQLPQRAERWLRLGTLGGRSFPYEKNRREGEHPAFEPFYQVPLESYAGGGPASRILFRLRRKDWDTLAAQMKDGLVLYADSWALGGGYASWVPVLPDSVVVEEVGGPAYGALLGEWRASFLHVLEQSVAEHEDHEMELLLSLRWGGRLPALRRADAAPDDPFRLLWEFTGLNDVRSAIPLKGGEAVLGPSAPAPVNPDPLVLPAVEVQAVDLASSVSPLSRFVPRTCYFFEFPDWAAFEDALGEATGLFDGWAGGLYPRSAREIADGYLARMGLTPEYVTRHLRGRVSSVVLAGWDPSFAAGTSLLLAVQAGPGGTMPPAVGSWSREFPGEGWRGCGKARRSGGSCS